MTRAPGKSSAALHVSPGAPHIVDTLLRSEEPSIRWKVRTRVLGEPTDGKAARRLREEIRQSPRVRRTQM